MKIYEYNGKWVFNDSEYGLWNKGEEFETREEVIKYGTEYAKENQWESVFIGQIKEIPVKSQICAEEVINDTAEYIDDNYDSCDLEFGQKFIDGISTEDSDCLQKLLDTAFYEWVKVRGIATNSYQIGKVEEIKLAEVEK